MLDSKRRARLSSLAQELDCLVAVGRAGASPELAARLEALLAERELVKLRFGDFKASRRELADGLARRTGSELVRLVGNVAIFWKPNADPEKRKIDRQ